MNWNTNVISSAIKGKITPLMQVLPAGASAITWAFATGTACTSTSLQLSACTGECGSETWAGINATALATVNIPLFEASNVDYIISTGGADGMHTQ